MGENEEISMNKPFDGQVEIGEEKSKAIVHKDSALRRLDLSFNRHIELSEYKKSNLLAYWINDFSNYHDNERTFDSKELKTFKRGDIIKANLGFNIGNELGGLHYCVVINKNDNPYSNTLNVVPLSSIKENKEYNSNTCVNLGDELYTSLQNKFDKESISILNQISRTKAELDAHKTVDIKSLLEKVDYLEKIRKEILRMRHGSVAFIHQITTISKQRIFRTSILSGIKLSNQSLDLIDEKIIKLFTK